MKSYYLKTILFFFTLLVAGSTCSSQNLSAYSDYRGYLQAFDNGMFRQLEYLPVKSYKFGQSSVAYIDNKNDFKIYYKGKTYDQLNAADFSYFVTDHLIAYKVGSVLYVFDSGEKKTLSYYNSIMTVNDSILAYYDDSKSELYAYYKGRTILLEESLLDKPRSMKAGSNVLAWVNQSGFFNVLYHGRMQMLDNIPPVEYAAGQDILAFVDDYDRYFHLFYKGDKARVESFAPDSFKVGFGIMAYVDHLGNFRVFENGSTRRLLSDRPDFFYVKGNVIVYSYNRMFNIYYKGEVKTLENYSPSDFQLGNDGLAWIDESGRLKLFDKGNIHTASFELIRKYNLTGNVLKYESGVNTVSVFYKGRNY
ncbi:MAG: hypothetical protein DWQ44_05815 [Bacteroidetes bacterium]|nr:MAG: hypothetical protein DWQ39_10100 [Bacteroidota bacterium]REK34841.1 MAG: hypothetical protein DWQ44_05815 [Bacteroidota bacterium]